MIDPKLSTDDSTNQFIIPCAEKKSNYFFHFGNNDGVILMKRNTNDNYDNIAYFIEVKQVNKTLIDNLKGSGATSSTSDNNTALVATDSAIGDFDFSLLFGDNGGVVREVLLDILTPFVNGDLKLRLSSLYGEVVPEADFFITDEQLMKELGITEDDIENAPEVEFDESDDDPEISEALMDLAIERLEQYGLIEKT